ncbi:MAG TPA: hypothetical protein PKH65_08780 [Bacteroidia bacterium]|nr:hypothetical protein [Bacteroidia bacterium]
MNKNLIIVFSVIVLGLLALYFNRTKQSGTLKEELKNFAITDTSQVSKIFLADKNGNQVTLTKESSGKWLVDGTQIARNDAITTLLYTMQAIDVRSPVGKNAYNTVMKNISANGVKVEIYSETDKLKTYYVGGHNQDMLGTYMYLEGSSVPFVMHIAGFNGYLTPRYNPRPDEWIIRNVFSYQKGVIKNLKMENLESPEQSFELIKETEDRYQVQHPVSKQVIENANMVKVMAYLSIYKNINYTYKEVFPNEHVKDSILDVGPFRKISIESTDGQKNIVWLYRKHITENSLSKEDSDGNPRKYDIDYLYGKLNKDSILVRMQYYSFDPILNASLSTFQ